LPAQLWRFIIFGKWLSKRRSKVIRSFAGWRGLRQGRRGKEGMDLIRALMFLTLGAVVAESFGAEHVFQYENGCLAMAIPPAGTMVPTRHAHPELHRRMQSLRRIGQ